MNSRDIQSPGSSSPFGPEDTAIILDSIADGVFTIDERYRITSFNRAAEEITGVKREEAIGKRCCEVLRADICESDCALKETLTTGKPVFRAPIHIVRSDGERVPISISTALLRDRGGGFIGGVETFRDLSLVEQLRQQVEGRYSYGDILTRSSRMNSVLQILPQVAESSSTILITGESGTGKEVFARAIHDLSPRRSKPLVVVNCAAIPETLLESELFGYVAGAFTDARRDKPGKLKAAKGGTLLLDEIAEVVPRVQVKLLRVLQEKVYEPLGATRPVKADVRILAATNRDLEKEIAAGRFREDLFYRLNVIRIDIPSLRERREDVALFAEHFLRRFRARSGKDIEGFSQQAMAVFLHHEWPGNVRELENAVEHASVLCRAGLIEIEHLPEHLRALAGDLSSTPLDGWTGGGKTLEEIETRAILEALKRHSGKKLAVARELGINKTTLWRKLTRLGIDPGTAS